MRGLQSLYPVMIEQTLESVTRERHISSRFSGPPHFPQNAAKRKSPRFSPCPSAMAPPPPDASAAAEAEPLEVRCKGCGETLEVDRGLTEFICPDCATPQSLPPELMPKPPRRKALPLPRGAADVRGARLPCGACGALLSVPVGLPRCACPLCGAELAVDTTRLRQYLLSSAAAADAVPVVPLGASSSVSHPILRTCEVQLERPNRISTEQAHSGQPNYTIDEGEEHGFNRVTVRYKEQQNICPGGPSIASAEMRQDQPLNQVGHQTQDSRSIYSGRTKHASQEHLGRVIESPRDSVNSALFRESGCDAHTNETTSSDTDGATGRSIQPRTDVNVESRNMHTPIHIIQKSQKQRSCYVISTEHAQSQSANGATHVQEKQHEALNDANHMEDTRTQLVSETIIADDNVRRRTRRLIGLNAMGAEERHGQIRNEATQQLQKDQSCSVVRMVLSNQVNHVENEQPECQRVHNRKRRGLIASLNSGIQLRRSKRLAKDSSAVIDNQPVRDTEILKHGEIVVASSNGQMPIATAYDESTESEPDGQQGASPVQSLSDHPDVDTVINNICTSSSPRHEIPQTSSNELENLNPATPLSTTNPDMSNPEHFARNYIPLEVRRALAKLSGEGYLCGLTDLTGEKLQSVSQKNGRRTRGARGKTLCLKIWTMPKGVRIPVPLNTIGEPIGKEAATLSSFLGVLSRDGVLAPLTYHDWRHVPEKNKAVMYHIVKLKFDVATLDELWIVNSIAKKWRNWKFSLKKEHFDTHETEEERLADRNPRVLEEQWKFLVAYWSTEKAQALSATNKACAGKVTTFRTTGTKSFARVIEEEREKRPNKDEPSHEDIFILTHTPKDGKPMKTAAPDAFARFCEQVQKVAEGSGSNSDARNLRLGFCPRRPRKKATLKASLRVAMEAKRRAEEEAAVLREKMIAMEENHKKLREDKSVNSSNMMVPDKHVHNMLPISDFPEVPTGQLLVPPGFP